MKATFLEGQNAKIITSQEIIASVSQNSLKENLGINASVASNALTLALVQKDGSTNATETNSVRYSTRGTTEADGDFAINEVTAAVSLVISSGSTLGTTSGAEEFLYVYGMGGAGARELAVSLSFFADGTHQSTTAEGGAGAADNAAVLYSTTARTDVPIVLLARVKSNQATAGTWATDPSEAQLNWSPRYTLGSVQTFSASGTWTKPDGVAAIVVEVVGGGGGGGSAGITTSGQNAAGSGGGGGGYSKKFISLGLGATETVTVGAAGAAEIAGGNSSFGSHLSGNGGAGGATTGVGTGLTKIAGGAGGTATGGKYNIVGTKGEDALKLGSATGSFSGGGGSSTLGHNGASQTSATGGFNGFFGTGFGGGGGGAVTNDSGGTATGGSGTAGLIIVWEYY